MELFDSRYFSGQGPLYIATRTAAGEPDGLTFIGDVGKAEITPNVERGQVIESVTGSRGVGASWLKRSEFTLSLTMRSIKGAHLAQVLQGTATAKAASSVTDEAGVARLGKFTKLAQVKVSTVVITGPAGTPVYVADTDYKVHGDEGMIEWLTGGTIAEDNVVEMDYAYAAQTEVPSDPQNTPYYLVFTGMNVADGNKQTRVEMYKVKLDPGAFGLIQEDSAEATIGGVLELDSLRAAGDQFFKWTTED